MGKFKNTKTESFLNSEFFKTSLDDENNNLTLRCKFNFSYFDNSQDCGQDFDEWTEIQLQKLLNKVKEYSKFSLKHWSNQKVGSGKHKHNILEIYGAFPTNTDFKCPTSIPHQVEWGRFRLENKVRLIGFVIPSSYHKTLHSKTMEMFDKNTFYVVFLDKEHKFYKTEKA